MRFHEHAVDAADKWSEALTGRLWEEFRLFALEPQLYYGEILKAEILSGNEEGTAFRRRVAFRTGLEIEERVLLDPEKGLLRAEFCGAQNLPPASFEMRLEKTAQGALRIRFSYDEARRAEELCADQIVALRRLAYEDKDRQIVSAMLRNIGA